MLILTLFTDVVVNAQQPLRIQVQVNKPYPNKLSDFQSNPAQVVILVINNSQSTYSIQLLGSITGDNGVRVATSVNHRSSRSVDIAPLGVTRVSAEDIGALFNPDHLVYSGFSREQAFRMNGVPEGYYQVCIRAVDFNTRAPLSDEEPFGCSNVFMVSSLEPPVIIKPFDEESLPALIPQNIVFSWTLPPGAPPSTQYTLRLVEVPEGRNPFDVMRSSRQSFFETTVTGAPTLLYGPSAPPLITGRQYALMVTAEDPFGNSVFRNGGRSEVISFRFGASAEGNPLAEGRNRRRDRTNIPRSTIKGRIEWHFRSTEEQSLALAHSVELFHTGSEAFMQAFQDPTYGSLSATQVNQISSGQISSVALQASVEKPTHSVMTPVTNALATTATPIAVVGGAGQTLSVVSAPIQAVDYYNTLPGQTSILGNKAFPLQRAPLKVYAVSEAGSETLISTTETDDEGNFEASFINTAFYNPALGKDIRIHVDHPDFNVFRKSIRLPKADSTGHYDIGVIKAVARTFRFKPTVVDEEGKVFADAVVEIYRPVSFYDNEPNLRNEGDRHSEPVMVNGQQCVRVSSVRSEREATKLFYSDGWTDQYIVKVVHEKLVPRVTTLSVSPSPAAREEVLLVSRQYRTMMRMPTLKGKIEKNTTPILPGSGAVVTLYFNDDADFGPHHNTTIETVGTQYLNAVAPGATALSPLSIASQSPLVQPNAVSTLTQSTIPNLLPPAPKTSPAGAYSVGGKATSLAAAVILAKTRSTTADSAGHFFFSDLPTSSRPTKMTVRLPGSTSTYEFEVDIRDRGVDYDMGNVVISMTVFTLVGKITDEEGKPISSPRLHWTSGGTVTEGDELGRFSLTHTAGSDTLIVEKLGYQSSRIPVSLKEPSTTGGGQTASPSLVTPSVWGAMLQQTPSLKQTPADPPFTAASIGHFTIKGTHAVHEAAVAAPNSDRPRNNRRAVTAPTPAILAAELQPLYDAFFSSDEKPVAPIDLGTIRLRKKVGRLLVRVTESAGGTPVTGASVKVADTGLSGSTNAKGEWYSEVPGGEIIVEVSGDVSRGLAAGRRQILTSDVDTTTTEIALQTGVVVKGRVSTSTTSVTDARIEVVGLEYMATTSDENGSYSFVVPKGDYTLQATRRGYVGALHQQIFSGNTATVNFNLQTAPFNINSIYGFDIEITKMQGAGNSRIISGFVVNLPSNRTFIAKAETRLPFDNITVDITNDSMIPRSGQLNLSATTLDLLAYGYLPVTLRNNNQPLTIRQAGGNLNAGELIGVAEIRWDKFIPTPLGLTIPADAKYVLSSGTSPTVTAIHTSSSESPAGEFRVGVTKPSASLYGFDLTIDATKSFVSSDGVHFSGSLNLNGIPLLGNTSLAVDEVHIGTNGSVQKASIALDGEQQISMAQWRAAMKSVRLNENGLKLSGNVRVTVPQSNESSIDFSNLTINKTSLYGGEFTLPSSGLDVFGIVAMKGGAKPLSFGRIGNGNVYYIGGSGVFNLPKFIDKTLTVEFFQVQTDGNFEARVPANFNVSFLNLARLSIRSIGFRTTGGVGVDVKGDFNLNAIPFFKASAGGIQYGRNGSASVEELGLGFDLIGIARLEARAKFVDRVDRKGFDGEGHIQIKGTPLDLGLGFRYYRLQNGIEVGGLLRAGVVIPIGIVTLAEVEGEFNLNTQDNKWMGRIGGSLSIGGLNYAVAVRPLSITVENGPVFRLKGGLSVIQQNIATAEGILDFPRSYFGFTFRQDLSILPELMTTGGSGAMILSTARDNTYWLMAAQYHASMLGDLVKGNANVTVGWGLNVDRHPEFAEYTSFINRNYLDNGTLKGIHVATHARIRFDTGERGFAGVASGRAWYNNYGDVRMDMGFGAGNYGFSVAAGWEAGAYLKIADQNVAGVIAGIDGGLSGYYTHATRDLSFQGYLRAKLIAWIGSCTESCENKICWGGCFNACILGCEVCPIPVGGKLCLQPGVRASFNTHSGFDMGIDF